jgi:diguanylate cyclase (GGDEF)-like protein
MSRGASTEGRLARRHALPFVYVGLAGVLLNAAASDNRHALDTWQFLVGAALSLAGVVFMTVWTRELPPRVGPLLPLGGMIPITLMAGATGGVESAFVALLLLPLMWFGYNAVGRQVMVGAAGFVAAVSTIWYLEPAASRLSLWDEWATDLLVGVGLLYGISRIARDRRDLTERLAESARTDPLTNLLNRRGFEDAAAAALARAKRDREVVALLMFDLDGFKVLNDTHGHQAGDELLMAAAEAWRRSLRAGDVLGRAGGDEFYALLVDTDHVRAGEVADRLRARTPSGVSCSVGIALFGPEDGDLEGLVTAADRALYAAKAAGRDRVVFAPDSAPDTADLRAAAVAVPAVKAGTRSDDLGASEHLLADARVVRLASFGDRFVDFAPEAQEMLGWDPEEPHALTFAELIHPDDWEVSLAAAARAVTSGAAVHGFESRFRCRNGRYRRLGFHMYFDGKLWRAIVVDLGDADPAVDAAGESTAA